MSGNRGLYSDILADKTNAVNTRTDRVLRKNKSDILLNRTNSLSRITGGETEEKTLFWVEPGKCRLWEFHDRDYSLLNKENCADLIEGFKTQGKQEFPAIVRQIAGDTGVDYEIICGARRHWTVTHLRNNHYTNFKFLIDVRSLTDEECFRLSDVENRDREDISDYERALKYKRAIGRFYKTQQEMANRLEVAKDWLSRFLDLADLQEDIVKAYPDIRQIKVDHGRQLKPFLKESRQRQKLLKRAKEIQVLQDIARQRNKGIRNGAQVLRELILSVKEPKKIKSVSKEYLASTGKKMLKAETKGRGALTIHVLSGSQASKQELVCAFEEAISELFL